MAWSIDLGCTQCHATEATSLKRTAVSSEVCVSCHDMDEHAAISCVDCHQAHDTGKSLDQTAKTTCGNCHHAGVYECGTCR